MTVTRRLGLVLAALLAVGSMGAAVPASSGAAVADVDPAALPRGDDPGITYLLRDTIHDGALRVPATTGQHVALWNTARGYVVADTARHGRLRLVHVAPTGDRNVLTRRSEFSVAVSANGRRLAWDTFVGPVEGPPSVVTVVDPATGRVVATRKFAAGAHVVAVTGRRVLLARLSMRPTNATFWWNYERDTLRRYYDLSAVRVDFGNDRIVFDIPRDAPACNRVALFTRPSRELWRSCSWYPAAWSPDGRYAISTYTYFDAGGTARWRVVDGRTGERLTRVTGRLDWHAVWEDERHFLTMAMNPAGDAAVIRCDVAARCERASRLWAFTPESYDFYLAPPVVLASN
ncbi:MAG: hypothetical protein ACTHKG_17210 [Nocardioides sp.]